MTKLPGRLGALVAHDVMTSHLITVNEKDTIETAIATLKEHEISGAPVVDDAGKLVGIISIADFIREGPRKEDTTAHPVGLAHAHGHEVAHWQMFDRTNPLHQAALAETVGQRMSRHISSVMESAPLVEVARAMCRGHWHRVPVVTSAGSLTGIISSMDVLAALVNVSNEPD